MTKRLLLMTVCIAVWGIPWLAAAKSIPQTSNGPKQGYQTRQIIQLRGNLLTKFIAVEQQRPFFKYPSTIISGTILFMEQFGDKDDPNPGISSYLIDFLPWCITFVFGFFFGYFIGNRKGTKRRKRVKKADPAKKEQAEQAELGEAQIQKQQQDKLSRPWTSRLLGTQPENSPAIQETAPKKGDQANEQAKSTPPSNEKSQEGQPVTVVYDNIQNNLPAQPPLPPPPPPPKRTEVFYFPSPNTEGEFRNSEGRENYTEGTSIYKFTIDKSETRAKFEFCAERTPVKMALANRNELILRVAEELNAYNAHSDKIVSEQFGEAILDGAIWKVTSKVKIKYDPN